MRCHICDKTLTDVEIQRTPDNESFEPCSVCMEIIMDTAYCDGFVREEPLDEPELEDEFGAGAVEILDLETFRTSFYGCSRLDGFDPEFHNSPRTE